MCLSVSFTVRLVCALLKVARCSCYYNSSLRLIFIRLAAGNTWKHMTDVNSPHRSGIATRSSTQHGMRWPVLWHQWKKGCQFPWFYSTSVLYSTLSATLSKPRATTSYYKEEPTSRQSSLCGRTGVFCQLKTFCNSPGGPAAGFTSTHHLPNLSVNACPAHTIYTQASYILHWPRANICDTAWGTVCTLN